MRAVHAAELDHYTQTQLWHTDTEKMDENDGDDFFIKKINFFDSETIFCKTDCEDRILEHGKRK